MKFKICKVETLSSHSYPGRPAKFFFEGKWHKIDYIDDQWYEGGLDPERALIHYFRVSTEGKFFLLRYLPYFQKWQVLPIDDIFT